MKLDKTLLVNMVISLVVTFVCYYVFQAMEVKFEEVNFLIVFLLILIYLELERKKK